MPKKEQMAEWFASWFDTPYYHTLYKDRDHTEAKAFIRQLFASLTLPANASVVDLACGKGRHAVFINSLGYDTTGVDLSEDSIQSAKKHENDRLDFFVHDMRNPLPNKSFDLVVNLFTSFGYFEHTDENIKVLNAIRSYLKDDGLLVIDFLNADNVIENLVPKEIKEIEGITFNIHKKLADDQIIKNITFEDNGEHFAFQEKVQALRLSDFQQMLEETNFEIKAVYGNYNLEPLDASSDRLIIIAKKKA